jgi:hypothetical protein
MKATELDGVYFVYDSYTRDIHGRDIKPSCLIMLIAREVSENIYILTLYKSSYRSQW